MLLNEVIGVRAYNVCKKNGLATAAEIMDYYKDKGTFMNLPHCGKKSDEELVNLCMELEEVSGTELNSPKVCHVTIFEEFTSHEIETINRYIAHETKILSQRSSNALSKYLNNDVDIHNLCEKVYRNTDFQVMNLHNVGKGAIEELTSYLDNVENFVSSVYEQK